MFNDKWKFIEGNNTHYIKSDFNDKAWKSVNMKIWCVQKNKDLNDTIWYRYRLSIPSSLKKNSYDSSLLKFVFKKIEGVDQIYLNEHLIGDYKKSPSYPMFKAAPYQIDPLLRIYFVPSNLNFIKWDKENTIAIRIIDKTGNAGISSSDNYVCSKTLDDAIAINTAEFYKLTGTDTITKYLAITKFSGDSLFKGKLEVECKSVEFNRIVFNKLFDINLKLGEEKKYFIDLPVTTDPVFLSLKIKDQISSHNMYLVDTLKYVLVE